jgi:hypothetical protein
MVTLIFYGIKAYACAMPLRTSTYISSVKVVFVASNVGK